MKLTVPVETGKVRVLTLAVKVTVRPGKLGLPELESPDEPQLSHDSSTNALIRRYRSLKS